MPGATGRTSRHERDPLGAELPLWNPSPTVTYPSLSDEGHPFLLGGDPLNVSSGCKLDGMPISCSWAQELSASGMGVSCPNGDCGPRTRVDAVTGKSFLVFFNAFADGYSGFMRAGSVYLGHGQYLSPGDYPDSESEPLRFNHASSLPQKPVVVPLTEQQKATVKDDLAGVLKNKECEDVVKALIAQAEKNTGFKAFSHNLMDTFGKVTSFGSDGIANASAGGNAGSPGGITLRVNYPLSNDDPLIRNLNGRKMIHEMFHGNRGGDLSALTVSERSYSHLDMHRLRGM
jgi:hypothetical protein